MLRLGVDVGCDGCDNRPGRNSASIRLECWAAADLHLHSGRKTSLGAQGVVHSVFTLLSTSAEDNVVVDDDDDDTERYSADTVVLVLVANILALVVGNKNAPRDEEFDAITA